MLRLVKPIADLPNVSYVIAADHTRIREVVAKGSGPGYGQAFLEKIIQVPVFVPPISETTIERLAGHYHRLLEAILYQNKIVSL